MSKRKRESEGKEVPQKEPKPNNDWVVLLKRVQVSTTRGAINTKSGPKAYISICKTNGSEITEESKELKFFCSGNVDGDTEFKLTKSITVETKKPHFTDNLSTEGYVQINNWGKRNLDGYNIVVLTENNDNNVKYYMIPFMRKEGQEIMCTSIELTGNQKALPACFVCSKVNTTFRLEKRLTVLDYHLIIEDEENMFTQDNTKKQSKEGSSYKEVEKDTDTKNFEIYLKKKESEKKEVEKEKEVIVEVVDLSQLYIDTDTKNIEIYLKKKELLASLLNVDVQVAFDGEKSDKVVLLSKNNYICIQASFKNQFKVATISLKKLHNEDPTKLDSVGIEKFSEKKIEVNAVARVRNLFDLFVYNSRLLQDKHTELFRLFSKKKDCFERNISFYLFGFGYTKAIEKLLESAYLEKNEQDILGNEIGYYVGEQLQYELSLSDEIKTQLGQPKRLSQRKTFNLAKTENSYKDLTEIVDEYTKALPFKSEHKQLYTSVLKNYESLKSDLEQLKNKPPQILCFVGTTMQGKSYAINQIALSEIDGLERKDLLFSCDESARVYSVTKEPTIVTFNEDATDESLYLRSYYVEPCDDGEVVTKQYEPFKSAKYMVEKKFEGNSLQGKLDNLHGFLKQNSNSNDLLLFSEVSGPFKYLKKFNINLIDTCGSDEDNAKVFAKSVEISKSSNLFVLVFRSDTRRTIPDRNTFNSIEPFFNNGRIFIPYLCLCRSKLIERGCGISPLQVENDFYNSISTQYETNKNEKKEDFFPSFIGSRRETLYQNLRLTKCFDLVFESRTNIVLSLEEIFRNILSEKHLKNITKTIGNTVYSIKRDCCSGKTTPKKDENDEKLLRKLCTKKLQYFLSTNEIISSIKDITADNMNQLRHDWATYFIDTLLGALCNLYNVDKNTIYYYDDSFFINEEDKNEGEDNIEKQLHDMYVNMVLCKEKLAEQSEMDMTNQLVKKLDGQNFKKQFVTEMVILSKSNSFLDLFYDDYLTIFLQFWEGGGLFIDANTKAEIRRKCQNFCKNNNFNEDTRKHDIKKITSSILNIPDSFQIFRPLSNKGTAIEHKKVQEEEISYKNTNFSDIEFGTINVSEETKTIVIEINENSQHVDITLYQNWESDLRLGLDITGKKFLNPIFIPSKDRYEDSLMDSLLLNTMIDHIKDFQHILYIVVEDHEVEKYITSIKKYMESKKIQRNWVMVSIPGYHRGIAFSRSMIKVLYKYMNSVIPQFKYFWTLDDDLNCARFFSPYSSNNSGMEPVAIGFCLHQCERMFVDFSKEFENRLDHESNFEPELQNFFLEFYLLAARVVKNITNSDTYKPSVLLSVIDKHTDEKEFCKELNLIKDNCNPSTLLQKAKELLLKSAEMKKKIMKLGWLSFGYGSRISCNYNRHEPLGSHFRYSTQMSKCTLHYGPATINYNYLSSEQLFLPQSNINQLINNSVKKKSKERALKNIISNKQYKFYGESTYYANLLKSDGIYGIVTHYFDILTKSRSTGGNEFLKKKQPNNNSKNLTNVIENMSLEPISNDFLPFSEDIDDKIALAEYSYKDLTSIPSEKDGFNNCMFYSTLLTIPYALELPLLESATDQCRKAEILRQMVSEYILGNQEHFIHFFESEANLQTYARDILDPKVMGDQFTLKALAEVLGVTIRVHVLNSKQPPLDHGDGDFIIHLIYDEENLHYDGAKPTGDYYDFNQHLPVTK